MLATLHLPPDWYPDAALNPVRPRGRVHCVSQLQASRSVSPVLLSPIPNGVPVTALGALHPKRCGCALAGLHHALAAARAARTSLLIGGQVFPYAAYDAYFQDEITPRLDRRRRFVGPVGFAEQHRLLAAARCLLIPSLVAETSSLVAMEAACGTPVIAFRIGALPEAVEHGRAGLIVGGAAGRASALAQMEEIDRKTCRDTARGAHRTAGVRRLSSILTQPSRIRAVSDTTG